MRRKLNDDENWLWTELAHSSFDVTALVRPGKEAADFHSLETVLNREILRLTWWRWPLAIVYIPGGSVLLFTSLEAFFSGKYQFPRNVLQPLGTIIQVAMGGMGIVFAQAKSNRWRNGVELAVHLSQSLPARSTVELLMTVLKWDEIRLPLNRKSLAPVLYRRLADVLMRVEDWKPDAKQQKLLQRIALSGRNTTTNDHRYPDALRVAALVTLADEPAALDEKFRARIATLSGENSTEASVQAAMGEVLRRF